MCLFFRKLQGNVIVSRVLTLGRGSGELPYKNGGELFGDIETNLYTVLESAFVGLAPVSQSALFSSDLFLFVFTVSDKCVLSHLLQLIQ